MQETTITFLGARLTVKYEGIQGEEQKNFYRNGDIGHEGTPGGIEIHEILNNGVDILPKLHDYIVEDIEKAVLKYLNEMYI